MFIVFVGAVVGVVVGVGGGAKEGGGRILTRGRKLDEACEKDMFEVGNPSFSV